MRSFILLLISLSLVVSSGCGYSTSSLLPEKYKFIHVDNFTNGINPESEVSNRRAEYTYWPGIEQEITRAVIDDFMYDKTLKVKSSYDADLLLKGNLTGFAYPPVKCIGIEGMRPGPGSFCRTAGAR